MSAFIKVSVLVALLKLAQGKKIENVVLSRIDKLLLLLGSQRSILLRKIGFYR